MRTGDEIPIEENFEAFGFRGSCIVNILECLDEIRPNS
jgi:hypothetical protein